MQMVELQYHSLLGMMISLLVTLLLSVPLGEWENRSLFKWSHETW